MIDGRAIIDPTAKLGKNVTVGPWSIVGPNVTVGDDVVIHSHVVLKGPTIVGAGVKIFQFATVGEDTPALAYAGEDTMLKIGEQTVIREGVTIHRGMEEGGIGETRIGKNCLLMAYVHIGHDCVVGNDVIMANNASLSGHVEVGDHANFGGYSGVPPFRKIGAFSHVAACSLVLKDIPAYMTVAGNPAYAVGLNIEGMKRRHYDSKTRAAIKEAHKIVYRKGLRVSEALETIEDLRREFDEVEVFAKSLETSNVGIIRGRGYSSSDA